MAYPALLSLLHILDQILYSNHHLFQNSKHEIESLFENVSFFQDFLEHSSQKSTKHTKSLEGRIRDVAYATEDVIESYMSDSVLSRSANHGEKDFILFQESLQEVIREINSIKKAIHKAGKVVQDSSKRVVTASSSTGGNIITTCGDKKKMFPCLGFKISSRRFQKVKKNLISEEITKTGNNLHDLKRKGILPGGPSRASLRAKSAMMGSYGDLIELKDQLTGQQSRLQIIPIVGMGGIGKTTLARNLYEDQLILEHFDIRAWVTISQEYSFIEMMQCLLRQINEKLPVDEMSHDQLPERLYKSLKCRRYLIVMDDIWTTGAWDDIRNLCPDDNTGSRIMLTTRQSNVALEVGSCRPHEMKFLGENESWDLLREKVFLEEGCNPELERIGMKIAKGCRGLPLSIVVVGGLLAKAKRAPIAFWMKVAEDVNSFVNSENDEQCLKILSLSYSHLPQYLKPCFLYMATFPEDSKVRVSSLIRLWVAEGFIKKMKDKTLEEAAEMYFCTLVDRNLIFALDKGSSGKVKRCGIHDLLRDLCVKEAQKDKFLHIVDCHDIPHGQRRFIIRETERMKDLRIGNIQADVNVLERARVARSIICHCEWIPPNFFKEFKLLKVLDVVDYYRDVKAIIQLVKLRYLSFMFKASFKFPSSIRLLDQLQSLLICKCSSSDEVQPCVYLPSQIWLMSQLRHVKCPLAILDPPLINQIDDCPVLENLQTLSKIVGFRFTDEIIRRLPNLKKLGIIYDTCDLMNWQCYHLNSLIYLCKLESLYCCFPTSWKGIFRQNPIFPLSLRKLTLEGCKISGEDMFIVGSLPNLAVLKLRRIFFKDQMWELVEGQYFQLKFLELANTNLVHWRGEGNCFPHLEHLVLRNCSLLEIPSDIGEIVTLRTIQIHHSSGFVVNSAMQILEEQQSFGNDDLQVLIW